jgi:ABC-2 type transport system permease protein
MSTLQTQSIATASGPSGTLVAHTSLIGALLTIAGRDAQRFFHNYAQLISSLAFPVLLIGGMGGLMQDSLGNAVSYSLVSFSVIGCFAMTLFTATVDGVASLIEDRDNDFGQELFIAPISPYAIILGKMLGQSVIALLQGAVTLVIGGIFFSTHFTWELVLSLIPVAILICLLGGAFSTLLTSIISNQRAAAQVTNLIQIPQLFLAGVFIPLKNLPWYLDIISKLSPMRYVIDLTRALFYAGQPTYSQVVLESPWIDLIVSVVMFLVCFIAGTLLFVRHERNR